MKKRTSSALLYAITWIALLFINAGYAASDISCPDPGGMATGVVGSSQYGPYDYRYNKDHLPIVENAHFTINVATLQSSVSGYLDGDIDYTLRAFPNHPRALQSLADLSLREHAIRLPHMPWNVPCYFIRATHFAKNDGIVNAIYAYYLSRMGQRDLAKVEAEDAIKKTPDGSKVVYTVGLAYFYIGEYGKAKEYAVRARKLGSTAPGLENLLSKSDSKDRQNK
jgi:tetratricopeptide (TPR) repeat protein